MHVAIVSDTVRKYDDHNTSSLHYLQYTPAICGVTKMLADTLQNAGERTAEILKGATSRVCDASSKSINNTDYGMLFTLGSSLAGAWQEMRAILSWRMRAKSARTWKRMRKMAFSLPAVSEVAYNIGSLQMPCLRAQEKCLLSVYCELYPSLVNVLSMHLAASQAALLC